MKVINAEIKASCSDPGRIRQKLIALKADFRGRDHQVDTYFRAVNGRLKLREGNIENNLIYYERPDQKGPKTSHCQLYETYPGTSLKGLLAKAMGVMTIVDKHREIYFVGNVKIHIDEVLGLGSYVEIEAQGEEGEYTETSLMEQCREIMKDLEIREGDLEKASYSDMQPG